MRTLSLKKHLTIAICFFSLAINAQTNDMVFEITSSALYNDEPTKNYSILVYENGIMKDSVFIKKTKPLNLVLETNKVYSIVFKKENCLTKVVIVNTEIPKGVKEIINDEPFNLQIEVSPEITKLKKEYDDYPVAILMFNKKKKLLMASENYYQLTHN